MLWIAILAVVMGIGAFVIYTANEPKRNPHLRIRPPSPSAPITAPCASVALREPDAPSTPWPPEVSQWVMLARGAFDAGDVDQARICYQKAAYGFAALTIEQNEELKREIASFTQHDPRYRAGLELVRHAVRSNPGTLQSELGKAAGDNREALNYVLYFAAATGDIVRVKSGRSYRLYLPEQPIPPEEPKKLKRLRKAR